MNLEADDESLEVVPNLTPMIDVVFLLLIFFMVTTTFLEEEQKLDIELPAAESGTTPVEVPEELVLTVLEDGRVMLGERELAEDEMREVLRVAAQRDPETPVIIRGDSQARHERIVAVMDACGSAGLTHLSVGTRASSSETRGS